MTGFNQLFHFLLTITLLSFFFSNFIFTLLCSFVSVLSYNQLSHATMINSNSVVTKILQLFNKNQSRNNSYLCISLRELLSHLILFSYLIVFFFSLFNCLNLHTGLNYKRIILPGSL